MTDSTPIHECPIESMWAEKEANDLKKLLSKPKIQGDPKARAILEFLSEFCQLKLKASWSGKELYNGFNRFVVRHPAHAFNFTNHTTSNLTTKSDLKKVCDQVFPYKNFKTKHYYIKTKDHIEFIQTQLAKTNLTVLT